MAPTYIPVLKAKPGELQALENMTSTQLRRVVPLLDISRMGERTKLQKRYAKSSAITAAYLDDVAEGIAAKFAGRRVMVDAFQWKPGAHTETGEHVIAFTHARLQERGVKTIPVLGYDRWDSPAYRNAMKSIKVRAGGFCVLRLTSDDMEDADDPDYFKEKVTEILADVALVPQLCAVMIDFGDVTNTSIEQLADTMSSVLAVLSPMNFKFFSVAGCSLPTTIDRAVKKHDSVGTVLRKEMIAWQSVRAARPDVSLVFGDYGVRGPNTADDVIAPDTNGKIRYTTHLNHFVARGHSLRTGNCGKQMYDLAKTIAESDCFMGPDFSWGDSQIQARADRVAKPGNSTNWIAFDTSHHLAWVLSEVEEFEATIKAQSVEALG